MNKIAVIAVVIVALAIAGNVYLPFDHAPPEVIARHDELIKTWNALVASLGRGFAQLGITFWGCMGVGVILVIVRECRGADKSRADGVPRAERREPRM